MTCALFIGRFQPFHNAHLKAIKDILKENSKINIIIGSSQEKCTKLNPFSYKERREMINLVLKVNKIKSYRIVPILDVYNDKKWVELIDKKVKEYDSVYTGNEWTERCFLRYGKKVRKIKLIRGISSTNVRNKIKNREEWKKLVPREVYSYIKKIEGDKRIKNINWHGFKHRNSNSL